MDGYISEARDLVADDECFDELLVNIEKALTLNAIRHDVELDDEAVEFVKDYICRTMVRAAQRDGGTLADGQADTPEAWFDRLYDEMREPAKPPAQGNVGLATGAGAEEHDDLKRLTGAAIAANRKWEE